MNKRLAGIQTNAMKKSDIYRNLATATIPICVVVLIGGWLLFNNLIAASILPAILFVASLKSNVGKYNDDIKRDAAGVTKTKFKATKAYELVAPDDSVGPSLCLDIDNNKCLLLNGQWLYDQEIYGESAASYYDEESDIFNCYNSPFSFPSTEFELWLSRFDGNPVKINILGEYLNPQEVEWPTPEKYYKSQHRVIDREEIIPEGNA